MPSEPGFNLSPERVKAGDEIKVTGNIGAVSTIIIGTFQLTAYGSGTGAAAKVTADVKQGGWPVYVAPPGAQQPDWIKVGAVIVD
ncbi:hypothetical protein [Pseudomonas sp. MWU16-30317]|uniref:hypothetical protein n=1 Tax=Pseudomonas sp. MWU16-30317 TaxID=2878095 RepID=UPI001CFB79D0|nr:hypothetical protein [Pseudomonas sp. MWU16-30317]